MTSSVSRIPRRTTFLAAIGGLAVAVTLGAESSRAQGADPSPFGDRFPNVVLKTHQGKTVRFYDDLLKGKVVVINFMYTTCRGR